MKKRIVSAVALTLISFASVQADNSLTATGVSIMQLMAQEKVTVKPDSLPEGVKKTIQGEAFEGWKVISAFLVTNADKSQYYELNVKKGEESARVKLDKDGKNVE